MSVVDRTGFVPVRRIPSRSPEGSASLSVVGEFQDDGDGWQVNPLRQNPLWYLPIGSSFGCKPVVVAEWLDAHPSGLTFNRLTLSIKHLGGIGAGRHPLEVWKNPALWPEVGF